MKILLPPGEILNNLLIESKLSAAKLARSLGVDQPRVSDILRGKRKITPDTALRLGRYFGNSGEMWLNLQTHYDLQEAHKKSWDQILLEVRPLKQEVSR